MFDDMILHDAYEGKLTTIVTFETYYMPSPQCMAALVFTLRHHDYTVPAAIHRQASMFQWVTTVGIDFS
jgi:hypothetical protein